MPKSIDRNEVQRLINQGAQNRRCPPSQRIWWFSSAWRD